MREMEWVDKLRHRASVHETDAEYFRQKMNQAERDMHTELDARDALLEAVSDVMAAKEKAEGLDG